MPGFATGDGTKAQCLGADEGARRGRRGNRHPPGGACRCSTTWATPSPRASRSTTSPSRMCRRACAPTICSASPTSAQGFVVGTGDLSELALGWCTYGVGDHMSHYGVNAGVPKTLIQYLIRWCDQDRPVRRARPTRSSRRSSTPRSRPSSSPPTTTARCRAPRTGSAPTSCTISSSTTSSATASRRPRSPSSPGRRGTTSTRGRWPADFPDALKRAYDLPTIRGWLREFLFRFFQTSQFKRSALPNSPKVSMGGALSPARRLARAQRRRRRRLAGRARRRVRGSLKPLPLMGRGSRPKHRSLRGRRDCCSVPPSYTSNTRAPSRSRRGVLS